MIATRRRLLAAGIGSLPAVLIVVLLAFAAPSLPHAKEQTATNLALSIDDATVPKENLEKLSIEELIDRLQPGSVDGSRFLAYMAGLGEREDSFLGLDRETRFHRRQLKSSPSQPVPVVWELIRRGLPSVPKLLEHLEDRRPTKAVFSASSFMGFVSHKLEEKPPRLSHSGGATALLKSLDHLMDRQSGIEPDSEDHWRYTVKVGDWCYFALGQIVNRPYHPVCKGPDDEVIVASPVHKAGLARLCRKEWGALTPTKHRDSLVNDCFRPGYQEARIAALTRLYFYYPEEGERKIIDFLQGPINERVSFAHYLHEELLSLSEVEIDRLQSAEGIILGLFRFANGALRHAMSWRIIRPATASYLLMANRWLSDMASDCLIRLVVSIPSKADRKKELEDFEKKHGKNMAKQIPVQIWLKICELKYLPDSINRRAAWHLAKEMMKANFPEFNPSQYRIVYRDTREELMRAVSDLPDFQNKNIDRVVYEIYKRATAPGIEEDHWTARECIELLAGKGHDAEFRIYLIQSIAALRKVANPNAKWEMELAERNLNELSKPLQ